MNDCAARHAGGGSRSFADLVQGPALLVVASLIDIFLATRVFVGGDPLVGSLSFFIFGATTGVPFQLAFARSAMARRLENSVVAAATIERLYNKRGAAIAGTLGAVATMTWLYALRSANATLVLPLANLTPVLLAAIEGLHGRLRFTRVIAPLAVLVLGLVMVRPQGSAGLGGLTLGVLVALILRNLAAVGSEIAERSGVKGDIATFTAARFLWLACFGVPLALTAALLTGRVPACAQLISQVWPLALPIHAVTMLLTFLGGFRRTRAKRTHPLTLVSAAYAAPLVGAPLTAGAVNLAVKGFFPTVAPSLRLLVAALVVVSADVWLAALCGGGRRQETVPSTIETIKGDHPS